MNYSIVYVGMDTSNCIRISAQRLKKKSGQLISETPCLHPALM